MCVYVCVCLCVWKITKCGYKFLSHSYWTEECLQLQCKSGKDSLIIDVSRSVHFQNKKERKKCHACKCP